MGNNQENTVRVLQTEDVKENLASNKTYATNAFLEMVYEDKKKKENLLTCEESQMDAYKTNIAKELKECLRLEELDAAYGCPLKYQLVDTFETFGVQVEKYSVFAIEKLPFPVFVLRPQKPNGAQVLYCHGHDDLGIAGALLERYDKVRYHKNLPVLLAKAGFTVVAPEFAGFGENDYFGFPEEKQPKGGCFAHMAFLTVAGYSVAGLRVLQGLKTLEFMEAEKLNQRILGFGVSGGGMICEYLGVLDPRIQAMCISCYASLLRNSILYKEHCVDNYVPGILQVGESHEILSTYAPRPLMTINGTWDRAFPVAGTNLAFPFLEKVYQRVGGEYKGVIFEGKHEINTEEVLGWFAQHA